MGRLAVTALTLSHFRSHRRAALELDGRPVAIYGVNGAGKTNILEAISLLSPGRGIRRVTADAMARAPEALGWKIRADLDAPYQPHQIETWADAGATSRNLRIDGKTAAQTALGRIARVLWLVPSMDRLWLDAASDRRRFWDRITLSLEPAHGEAVLAYERAMRERNRLLRDQVSDPAWYNGLEVQMAQQGATVARNRELALDRLMAAQDAGETTFPRAALTAETATLDLTCSDALADGLAASRRADMAAGRTLIGPHRVDLLAEYAPKSMPAAQCSTGEQKALLVSVILANARALALDFGAAPILLLDELSAHLDAGRRADLYDEICTLGAQAWMTGTEASLFAPLGARAQWLEISETAGLSEVTPHHAPG